MTKTEIEHATISHVINILAVMCAGEPETIIDRLTGYLWDDDEACSIANCAK